MSVLQTRLIRSQLLVIFANQIFNGFGLLAVENVLHNKHGREEVVESIRPIDRGGFVFCLTQCNGNN